MTVAAGTIIQRVRNLLTDDPWATVMTGTVSTTTTTTIPVPDGTRWDEGDILEFQDNGEQCYVRSVSSNNLTVIRGWNGTTATTHDGSTTAIVIFQDPTFTYVRIQEAADLVIQSLWPWVYKKVTLSVTYDATKTWYDLASNFIAPISITQNDSSATPDRLYIYGKKGSRLPVAVRLNLPTSLVASGVGISFPRGFGKADASYPVQVDYAAKLTTTGSYTDLTDGILAAIVTYGAAARMVMASEIPRVTQDDINMGDQSVVPGSRTRAGRDLYTQFLFLRNQYNDELRRTMPLMGGQPQSYSTQNYGISGTGTTPYV